MGTLPGGTTSRAYSVSSDGSIIVGISNDSSGNDNVYIYNVASSSFVQTIIPPSSGNSYSTDIYGFSISSDGSVVTGYLDPSSGTENAFRYTNGTLVDLGFLPTGTTYSYSIAISKDGSTIVGYADVNNDANEHAFKQVTNCIVIPSAEGDIGSLLCLNCVECATPNPQTGVYDSSRITENKEGRVIRDYIIKNGCHARPKPVFQSYADYMKYLNASLRH
jgi:probable HAF family extracellular repeat protein